MLRAYGVGSPLTLTVTGPRGNGVIDALERQLQAEWASCGIGLIIHNVPMKTLLKTVLPQGRYQLALAPYVDASLPDLERHHLHRPGAPDVDFVSPEPPPGQCRFEQHLAVERADACGNRARGGLDRER